MFQVNFYPFLADWGSKVDVVGFCFLDLASNYQPPESLLDWLKAGTRPIYIGFGSLVSFLLKVPLVFPLKLRYSYVNVASILSSIIGFCILLLLILKINRQNKSSAL